MQRSVDLTLTQALIVPQGTEQVIEGKEVQQRSLQVVIGTMTLIPGPLNAISWTDNIPLSPS